MLNKKMSAAINEQINEEMYSFYLYLAMAEYAADKGLPGMQHWMRCQAMEELGHAVRFMNYMAEKGGKVELKALKAPPKTWKTVKQVFEEVLKHEEHITGCINNLVDLALSLKDHATSNMLNWFISEQVEEEASAKAVIDMINLTGSAPGGMFMVDKELAARPAPPDPMNPAAAQ
ncbi:MAG: ferritin [Candidatus Rifleibacteriota bacterium]